MEDPPAPENASVSEEAARRHVERLVERNRRDTGIDLAHVEPRPIRSVGIVGAGMMGTAIAATHVKAGLPVAITDADRHALSTAPERIAAELAQQIDASDAECAERVGRLVAPTVEGVALGRCDLVLESVVETVAGKHEVYARLVPHLADATILASNTSTIPIARLAAGLPDAGRFCGIHFFHPVRHRSLVEIVRGPATSDATIAAAVGHAKRIAKMPIVVEDGPAFLVNRLLSRT